MHYTAGFSCFNTTRKLSVPKLLLEPLESREAFPQPSVCDGCSKVAGRWLQWDTGPLRLRKLEGKAEEFRKQDIHSRAGKYHEGLNQLLKGEKQRRDWSTAVIVEISLKSICCCPGEKPECCILWGQINLFSERGRKGVARFQSFFLLNKMCGWFLCLTCSCWPKGFVPPGEQCRTGTWILLSNACSDHHIFWKYQLQPPS